jgi:protein-tyrosine phosphatase
MVKHGPLVFEYSKITKYIYIGTNQCCQIHFANSLLRRGIKADLSLEEKRMDSPFGVSYYFWLPIKDHAAPTIKQLSIASNFLDALVKEKTKVYIHCERGHGRAPTIAAAYFISAKNWNLKRAIEFIKKKRSAIHPNKKQITALEKFSKQLRGTKLG